MLVGCIFVVFGGCGGVKSDDGGEIELVFNWYLDV